MRKISVGIDGSEQAATALRWAREEADLHGATLEAVMVWSYLDQHHADLSERFDPDYSEESARSALATSVAEAVDAGVAVEQRTICDLPVEGLLEASDDADLLVLGARGRGGFDGLLLGSTSERVTQLATRPVCVVRTPGPVLGGRVVVGVDGSAASLDALRWAAAEARARDVDLDVVHAWRLWMSRTSPFVAPDFTAVEAGGHQVLDSARADAELVHARVNSHFVHDTPARALMHRAAGAGLVVVGSRGHGRVAGAILGSVSRQVLHHAPCPVAVI